MTGTRNGLDVPGWSGRRAQEALEWVRHKYGRLNAPCCICHMPINYSVRGTDDSLSVQHLKSRKNFPHLTWDQANWRPAHLLCNKSAGADNGLAGLGITSQ
jgi:5-methylcytosine-specific restriction endonuclease McrA